MNEASNDYVGNRSVAPGPMPDDSGGTAICWGAILAGAAAAAALSLVLLILGAGLGLSAVSPWTYQGMSAPALGMSGILWLTFTQLAASGVGGYMAGRLRTRWMGTPADEVYFRDTAHGFLAWGVASLATAALLSTVTAGILGTGAQAAGKVAGGAATTAVAAVAGGAALAADDGDDGGMPGSAYFIDSLFRSGGAAPSTASAASPTPAADGTTFTPAPTTSGTPASATQQATGRQAAEVTRIFARGIASEGALPPDDSSYVAQLIAQRTGIPQAEAEQRVNTAYTQMQTAMRDAQTKVQQTADEARKAAALTALWLAMSLFVGAFVASVTALWGGRTRDAVDVTY